MPSDQRKSTMANATGLFFSPFDVTLAQEIRISYSVCIIDLPFPFFTTAEVLIRGCMWMASNIADLV